MVRSQTALRTALPRRDRPAPPRVRSRGLTAFSLYLGLTLLLFGPRILPHIGDRALTVHPGDWGLFVWAFEWWPHAVTHGLDPLFTRLLWPPMGLNLAWATVVPIPSAAMFPVTRLFGPVVAFNVVSLLAPASAAWTTYLLCNRLTRGAFAASLAGGFVFGFSPYLLSQLVSGHMNLSVILMLPVCAYLVVGLLRGETRPRRFVALLTAALVVEFGISTEVFATIGLFAGLGFGLGAIVAPADRRSQVLAAAGWVGLSFAIAAVVVSPVLYATFAYPQPFKPIFEHPVGPIGAADLLRLVVPGRPELFGLNFGAPRTLEWYYHLERYAWYVPIPLLAIAIHLWSTERRRPAVRIALLLFATGLVLALGPSIAVGHLRIPLPWTLIQWLPLVRRAFPYRVMAYAFLGLAVCVAYWLAVSPRSRARWTVFGLAGVLLLPNVFADVWTTDASVPAFFSSGEYRSYVSPGESVWIVDADGGRPMLWQTESGMDFRLAGGYTGVTPPGLAAPLREWRLVSGQMLPRDEKAIKTFVVAHEVGAVIVVKEPDWVVGEIAQALGATPVKVDDVTFISVPTSTS